MDGRNVRGVAPRFRLALDFNLEVLAVKVEVVQIPITEEPLKSGVHFGERNSQFQNLFAVDIQIKLRQIRAESREHPREFRALVRFRNKRVQDGLQFLRIGSRAVLKDKRESARRSDTGNRRKRERKNGTVRNPREFRVCSAQNGELVFTLALTLRPGFQHDDCEAAVRGLNTGDDVVAGNGEDVAHLFFICKELAHFLARVDRAVERGAVRQLNVDEERALVFIRHESGRHEPVEPAERTGEEKIESADQNCFAEQGADDCKIA